MEVRVWKKGKISATFIESPKPTEIRCFYLFFKALEKVKDVVEMSCLGVVL